MKSKVMEEENVLNTELHAMLCFWIERNVAVLSIEEHEQHENAMPEYGAGFLLARQDCTHQTRHNESVHDERKTGDFHIGTGN